MAERYRQQTEKRDVSLMDPYEILGISRGANADEIRKAFRTRAKEFHPDLNKAPEAEEMSKMVSAAEALLSDPEKRRAYDAGLVNIFGDRLAHPRRAHPRPPKPMRPEAKVYQTAADRLNEQAELLKRVRKISEEHKSLREESRWFEPLVAFAGEPFAAQWNACVELFRYFIETTDEIEIIDRKLADSYAKSSVSEFRRSFVADRDRFLGQMIRSLHLHNGISGFEGALTAYEELMAQAHPQSGPARLYVKNVESLLQGHIAYFVKEKRVKHELDEIEGIIAKHAAKHPQRDPLYALLMHTLRERKAQMWV